MTYFDRLRIAVRARDSMLCVGLDPDPKHIGPGTDRAVDFCQSIIDATTALACCYKPNAAFWEQYGPHGWEALGKIRQLVPPDIPVLLDCKRADVPNTMAAYASAVFDAMQFDAATIHAYHGSDSISEFSRFADRGVYVVCHTSNAGRIDLQHLETGENALFVAVADLAAGQTSENVGVVMGATAPQEVGQIRARHPRLPFLLPGIGRQGGDLESTVKAAFTGDPASCLIAVAGGIMYADDPRKAAIQWRDRVRRATDQALTLS